MVIKTERIADYQLGLLYRDRTFVKVLGPGVHRLLRTNGRYEAVKLDLRQLPVKEAALAALQLTHPEVVGEHFVVGDMADNEIGLVFADGKLVSLVAPGSVAFYAKRLRQVSVEAVDAAKEIEVRAELVAPLARISGTAPVTLAEVPSDHVGLLYVDGVLDRQLTPGYSEPGHLRSR